MSTDPAVVTTVPHIIKGRLHADTSQNYVNFCCPRIDLDDLVWPRHEPGPAFGMPIRDIIDFLVEVGAALDYDENEFMQEALEHSLALSTVERRILETTYRSVPFFFDRQHLEFQVQQETGWEAIDGWQEIARPSGNPGRVRAFPPRLAHIIAGNTPAVAVTTIVRGALSKGVNLIKVPANDLFTAAAILRTMSRVDPHHPTVRSFSAVYWKGGDTRIESAIMRPQFFDKLVVWGGGSAITNAQRYAGPGFDIVSFDPKVSVSMVGREAYTDDASLDDAAERAAIDISLFNQDACAASRYVYAEGDVSEVDEFCERLLGKLGQERPLSSAVAAPLSSDLRDEVEVLKTLEPIYRVWGDYSGAGLVVRSEDPVDFYPVSKTVNVVAVDSLEDAVRYANVATQTVGIYPPQRAAALRDGLASMGVQRVVALGEVAQNVEGMPHDGFYPIRRLMRWVLDDTSA